MIVEALAFVLSCGGAPTPACLCAPGPEPTTVRDAREVLDAPGFMFVGRVLSISFTRDSAWALNGVTGREQWFIWTNVNAVIAVREIFKGQVPDTVRVLTQLSDCGVGFNPDDDFLVDAWPSEKGLLTTTVCDFTGLVAMQAARLELFRHAQRQHGR